MGLARSWLEHNLSFLCANGETEIVTSCGESVHAVLHVMLAGCIEGTVIGKLEASDDSLFDRHNSFHMALVM